VIRETRKIARDVLSKIRRSVEKQYARIGKRHSFKDWYDFVHSKRAARIAYDAILKIPPIIPKTSTMAYMFVFAELCGAYRELKERLKRKKRIKRKERHESIRRRF